MMDLADDAVGAWICLDGVEGTGKTTITQALAAALPIEVAPEFSQAPFGVALRDTVRTSPHYISTSALGQSLVFLGDFLEVYASTVAPRLAAGASVVSDRGYLSKYVYQEVVLASAVGTTQARRLLDEVFAHLPPPDLTIYLTAPLHIVRARLQHRDGHCDQAREEFIALAADSAADYLHRNPHIASMTIDTNRPVEAVIGDIQQAVRRAGTATRHR